MKKEINYPIKSGIVVITRKIKPIAVWYHAGIILVEDGVNYVYHNDPDARNEKSGSIKKVLLNDYLQNKIVTEIYDSGLTSEQIKNKVEQKLNKKYNWYSFNCEHFIYEISGQRLKRNVLHPQEKIIIALLGILTVLTIIKIVANIASKK